MLFSTLLTAAVAVCGVIAVPTASHDGKGSKAKQAAAKVAAPGGNAKNGGTNGKSGQDIRGNYTSLNAYFKAHGKLYWGTATDEGLLKKPGVADFIAKEFGQVTPENSMKWDATEPRRGEFHFEGADYLVDYAQKNNLLIRGHTFIWWSQMPNWIKQINDKKTMQQVIENHISTVAGRYKGKIYAWDVLNEIFMQDGSFRQTQYYKVLGEDFVRIAFAAAKKADPHAKLYINDFNLDDPNAAKLQAMVKYVKKWISEGVAIDGIGSQSHLFAGMGSKNAAALKVLGQAAPEVAITELDITGAPAVDYKAVAQGCIDVKNCVGITSWGFRDEDSWLKEKKPTLFDDNFAPKAAVKAIMSS
ncbi:Endo-1,4-beta-xylanase 2 [Claviceps africana]|uniref:Beta-xylanase n=1 Tax=Claviceps africana TaxID=83212 RepID=A0A8K0J6J4_9HYPO|nr:Endo-1,4-beta-xylanase 2 [Claviceps africana]